MIERGQVRLMRSGDHVEVIDVFDHYSSYHQKEVLYVGLRSLSDGSEFVRRLPTVESYPYLYTRRTVMAQEKVSRWWLLDHHPGDNESNKIGSVMKAAGKAYCVGLVDENDGGVIGYLHKDVADEIVDKLNKED